MLKILYICTHNRCRSILSEAITNHYGQGKLLAKSAGSQPVGEVHPLSIKYLAEAGIPTENLSSQSWNEFEAFEADIVVTVCDSAAKESCPLWFGDSLQIHWGLKDPSKLDGSEEEVAAAFRHTINEIRQRVDAMIQAELAPLDKAAKAQALKALGAQPKG